MKICHVTSVHNRYDGRIFEKECTSLAKKYDVTLLCVDNQPDEILNNVKIIHVDKKFKNKVDRILNSSKILTKKALEIDADVYHLHDPELILLGKKLQKKGKKVIFDSHEDYPLLIMSKKWLKKPIRILFSKYYARLEKSSFPKFSAIISVTPHIVNRLKKYNKNCYMITNYPIINSIKKKETFGNYICFAGGITEQWSHKNIIKSLKNIDVEYKIAGKITDNYKNELSNLTSFNKVKLCGILSKPEVQKLYKDSTIGMALCQESANVNYHEGSLGNTKLFEYMAAGLPVICTNFILWEEIIKEYKCGICVNPNNVDEIEKAIKEILNNPKLQKEMSNNGIKATNEKFNWESEEKTLYKIYEKLNEE